MRSRQLVLTSAALVLAALPIAARAPQRTESFPIRGHVQTLYRYGPAGGAPIVVLSGDGGWIHLGPHVAEVCAAHGFSVTGFDVKAYLAGFTSRTATVAPEQARDDLRTLADHARGTGPTRSILIGVSVGAGLAVLAASDPAGGQPIGGVITLGLPDVNELGWRWTDSTIYLTHKVPNEPTFEVLPIIGQVAPVPLAVMYATHDEFVPRAEAERLFDAARPPTRLWFIEAGNHRFSDNLGELDARLLDALAWIAAQAPR